MDPRLRGDAVLESYCSALFLISRHLATLLLCSSSVAAKTLKKRFILILSAFICAVLVPVLGPLPGFTDDLHALGRMAHRPTAKPHRRRVGRIREFRPRLDGLPALQMRGEFEFGGQCIPKNTSQRILIPRIQPMNRLAKNAMADEIKIWNNSPVMVLLDWLV